MRVRKTGADSAQRLEDLVNIGPKIAQTLGMVGITTPAEFFARDPYDVFEQLLTRVDPTLCRCALASIVGAHQGIVWHKIHKQAAQEFIARTGYKWPNRC